MAPTPVPQPVAVVPETTQVRVLTAAGAYREAQRDAIFVPFDKLGPIKVRLVDDPIDGNSNAAVSDANRFLSQAARPDAPWDVANISARAAERACDAGMLATFDPEQLPRSADGRSAREDFLPGALTRCGIASSSWAALIAFDKRKFSKNQPKTLGDLFDLKRFPGDRALLRQPRYVLEIALMADGVPPAEVYTTLRKSEGLDRAFAKLDTVKSAIAWASKPSDAIRMLGDQKVAMAMTFTGRAFQAIAIDGRQFGIIPEGQVYDFDVWVRLKVAANAQSAADFIAFATAPEQLTAQARLLPYAPARRSAVAASTRQAANKPDLLPYFATSDATIATALRLDGAFWEEQESTVRARFDAWASTGTSSGEKPPATGTATRKTASVPRR